MINTVNDSMLLLTVYGVLSVMSISKCTNFEGEDNKNIVFLALGNDG